jgi:hypothetical protein
MESIPLRVNQVYVAPINKTDFAYGFNFTLSNKYQQNIDLTNSSAVIYIEAVSTTGQKVMLNVDRFCEGETWVGDITCSRLRNSTDMLAVMPTTTSGGYYALPAGGDGSFFGAFTNAGSFTPSVLNFTIWWYYYYGAGWARYAYAQSTSLPTPTQLSWLNSSLVTLIPYSSNYPADIRVQASSGNSSKIWFPSTPSLLTIYGPPGLAGDSELASWLGYPGPWGYTSALVSPGQVVTYYVTVFSWGSYENLSRYVFYLDSVTFPSSPLILKSGPTPFPIHLPSASMFGEGCAAVLAYDFTVPGTSYGTYSQPFYFGPWNVTYHTEPATVPTNVTSGSGQNFKWGC